MYRPLFFAILLPVLLQAQPVSTICAPQKAYCDSIMRGIYGENLFNQCVLFDSASFAWFSNHQKYAWNEIAEDDSVTDFMFFYYFRYPGAKPDSFEYHTLYGNPGGQTAYPYPNRLYAGKCANIDQAKMDSLAHAAFKQPLSACTVRLFDFMSFDDSLFSVLDSSHLYLELEYKVIRTYGRKQDKYELWIETVVIDACLNEALYSRSQYGKGKINDMFIEPE